MKKFYITFAKNHNADHLPPEIHKRVILIRAGSMRQANAISMQYFKGIYSMIYNVWTVDFSREFAPLGVTHELEFIDHGEGDIRFNLQEFEKPEFI